MKMPSRISAPFYALLAALTFVACSNSNEDLNEVKRIITPNRVQPPARATALFQAGVPRMVVSFPSTELSGIVLLEGSRDGVDTWLSAEGANLITEQGMLVGTRGFGAGLMSADISQSKAMVLARTDGFADRFHTYLTGNDETATRTYRCHIENRGPRDATISGRAIATRLMAESCNSLDQEFSNLYWVSDAKKEIVQARQWTGDFLGIVSTRTVSRK